jgi:N-acetylmuramoyl-L-alanine amidase
MTDSGTELLASYDKFMGALTLWREGRGEPYIGRQAIWCVLKNRLKSGSWGNTIFKVVTARWQFSCYNQSDPNSTIWPSPEDPRWHECLDIVTDDNSSDITEGAMFYFNPTIVRPQWADHMTMTAKLGNHQFYRS